MMELLPALKLGWLNGWLMLGSFYLVFGTMMLVLPRAVVKRLYDVSGWSRQQGILSAIGKPFSLACVVLIILTPLQVGQAVFVVGLIVFAVGFTGMMSALIVFRRTILGEERACAKRYGEPYQQFLKRVPRYLLFV